MIEEAQGEADSFDKLSEVDRQSPQLTRTQILWDFREQVLSQIPLTLLDPKAPVGDSGSSEGLRRFRRSYELPRESLPIPSRIHWGRSINCQTPPPERKP